MALEEEAEVVTDKTLDAELDDSIRATLKDINERNEQPVETAEATVATPEETVKTERSRDAEGKFAKEPKVKEAAAPAEQPDKAPIAGAIAPAAAAPIEAEAPLVTTTGQPIDINRAPSSWKPAAKAVWATLPEPVRNEIYRRESDFLVGNKGIRENADFGHSIKGIIEPHRAMIEAEGGTPEKAISNYFQAAASLRNGTPEQKLQTLFGLDKQFNAGLNAHFQNAVQAEVARVTGQPAPQPQAQPQTFQDPRVDQLMARMQQEEKDRTANEQRISNQATDKFLTAKDDKGQPLYPFVDNVIEDMSARVGILRRNNPALGHDDILKTAYDAAVWANPETRAVLISQQQATANQPVETLRKVEQAKRASAVNVPKRGAIAASEPVAALRLGTPESDESIRETYRQLTG